MNKTLRRKHHYCVNNKTNTTEITPVVTCNAGYQKYNHLKRSVGKHEAPCSAFSLAKLSIIDNSVYTLFVLFIGYVSSNSLQTLCIAVRHGRMCGSSDKHENIFATNKTKNVFACIKTKNNNTKY